MFRSILLNCGRDNTSCAPLRPTHRFETNPHSRFPIIRSFILTPLLTCGVYRRPITHLGTAERQFPSSLHLSSFSLSRARREIDITPSAIRIKSHTTRNVVTGHERLAYLFSPSYVEIDYARNGRASRGNTSEQLPGCKGREAAPVLANHRLMYLGVNSELRGI